VFLRYFDFIFQPFRAINNKIIGVKNIKGNIAVDVNRSKAMGRRAQNFGNKVGNVNQQLAGQAGAPQGAQPMQQGQGGPPGGGGQWPGMPGQPQMPQMQGQMPQMQGQMPQMPGMPGMPGGAPGQPGGQPGLPNGNPPIRTQGVWIWKKKFCTQCQQQLDRSWDYCPYCQQMAAQAAAAPVKQQAMKTQAFVMDATGGPSNMQLLGWIVPLQGPQRGELFQLSPVSSIGTDPKSTIVLNDKFMSSKHAEIKAENGVWILRDSGSTNGTYVNNRRVDRHELVDNDFIKFGSALLKFKSL
jgi:hypothetical protein